MALNCSRMSVHWRLFHLQLGGETMMALGGVQVSQGLILQ